MSKKGHRKFCIMGNVILQKALVTYTLLVRRHMSYYLYKIGVLKFDCSNIELYAFLLICTVLEFTI